MSSRQCPSINPATGHRCRRPEFKWSEWLPLIPTDNGPDYRGDYRYRVRHTDHVYYDTSIGGWRRQETWEEDLDATTSHS